MNIKFIFGLLAAITLFTAQLALVAALPGGHYFYVSLVVLVFIMVLGGLETAAWWFLLNGFLLDLFAFKFFGFYTLLFAVILTAVYLLFNNVLTNRSLYAFLLLVAVAVLFYDLASYLVLGLSWQNFFIMELKRLGANLLLTIVIFYAITLLSYRLRPVFLIRTKN